jgi:hypothetical protein
MSPYSPSFKEEEKTPITEIGHISGVLFRSNQGIMTNNEALLYFLGEYDQEHGKAVEVICSICLQAKVLASLIGKVPTCLVFNYLSPLAWASIGSIAKNQMVLWESTLACTMH